MQLSIRTKLFAALLAFGLLAVIGTQAFVGWSFQRGLETLALERRSEHIERIGSRLIDRYQTDGGWGRLRKDRALWIRTLFGGRHRHPDRQRSLGRGGGPRWLSAGDWPPERALRRAEQSDRPLPLELRLMLLDAEGRVVQGREDLLQDTERFPLQADGETVGALALLPGPSITELAELRFQRRQLGALLLITAVVTVLAALLALPLAGRLTRPVRALQQGVRRLAGGDHQVRVPADTGDEIGRLGRDINALAQTLGRNQVARQRWIADISHELRTPLGLLRGELEAMQDGVRPIDAGAIAALHGDVLRLGRLVDDLYQLSMSDLGALDYQKVAVHPGEVLADDLEAFRPRFEAAGIRVRLDDRLPAGFRLEADPQRLSQLFRNLLRNSLRYTEAGGELRVDVRPTPDDEVMITFEDSAPGVAETDLPRLFDRLYRVEGSRSRGSGGAGLGLAIAKAIVEAHGGRIEAVPSSLGGLSIRIALPVSNR
jgi:two-component system sensor histidine kinase BaeS